MLIATTVKAAIARTIEHLKVRLGTPVNPANDWIDGLLDCSAASDHELAIFCSAEFAGYADVIRALIARAEVATWNTPDYLRAACAVDRMGQRGLLQFRTDCPQGTLA